MPIYVRVEHTIRVDLPEGIPDEWEYGDDDSCPEDTRERVIEAALTAISRNVDVFIDGPDEEPVRVFCDVSDHDVTEVYAEGD